MPKALLLTLASLLTFEGAALAAVKAYSSDPNNGEPTDRRRISITICPPITVTPDQLAGYEILDDDGSGTVTLVEFNGVLKQLTDLGPDVLTGPEGTRIATPA